MFPSIACTDLSQKFCPALSRMLLINLVFLFLMEPLTFFSKSNTRFQNTTSNDTINSLIIEELKLLNGLKIFLLPTNLDSVTAVNLLIKSGSNQDPIDKTGLAQQTAQYLLFNHQKEQENVLKTLGIQLTVDVLSDSTIFQARLFPRRLILFLKILAINLTHPVVKKSLATPISNKTNLESQIPESLLLANLYFKRAIFGNHPYGRISREVKVTPKDCYQFLSNHYIPNNASLIVVGSFSSKSLIKEIRENFGPWTKKSLPISAHPKFPRIDKLSIQLLDKGKSNSEAGIIFGHTTPDRLSDDFYSLQALNLILGGFSNGSRLSRAFLAKKINYHFIDSQIRFYQSGGLIRILTKIPSKVVGLALKTIIETIENLKQFPVTTTELDLAKKRLLELDKASLLSTYLIADKLTDLELLSVSKNSLGYFSDKLKVLTVSQLQRAAKIHLSTTRAVTVIKGIDEGTSKDLNNFGSSEIFTIRDVIDIPSIHGGQ